MQKRTRVPGGQTGPACWPLRWLRAVLPIAPVLLLPTLAMAYSPRWLYGNPRHIDTWAYFGTAWQFEVLTPHFSHNYIWTRFAWILPARLLYETLDVTLAKQVFHGTQLYLICVFLYACLRLISGYAVAVVGVLLVCLDRFLLFTMGWDYPDGLSTLYLTILLFCLLRAALTHTSGPARARYLVAGGFLLGLVLNLHPMLLAVVPSLGLLYWLVRRPSAAPEPLARTALHESAWAALGLSVALGLFAWITWYYTGSPDFVTPNVNVAEALVAAGSRVTTLDRLARLVILESGGSWQYLPILATVVSSVYLVTARPAGGRLSSAERAMLLYFLATILILIPREAIGRSAIGAYWYFSYIYPGMYAALAIVLVGTLQRLSRRGALAALAALAAGTLVGIYLSDGSRFDVPPALVMTVRTTLGGVAVLLVALTVGWLVVTLRSRAAVPGGAVLSATLLVGALAAALTTRSVAAIFLVPKDARGEHDVYLTVLDGAAWVGAQAGGRLPRFLYDPQAPNGDIGNAVNAIYYWQWTWLAPESPALSCAGARDVAAAGAPIVVMGADEAALRAGVEGLRGCDLQVEERGRYEAGSGGVRYSLALVDVVDPSVPAVEPAPAEPEPAAEAPPTAPVPRAPAADLTIEPAAVAEVGQPVTLHIALRERVEDASWAQVAVGPADSDAADRFTILSTPSFRPGERTVTATWDTSGYAPGEYQLVVNVGLADGSVRWWYDAGAVVGYRLQPAVHRAPTATVRPEPTAGVTVVPAGAAEIGAAVAIRVALPEDLGEVAWVQAAVGRADSDAADRFTILGTPNVPPGARTVTVTWGTAGYQPGEYEIVVNVGRPDGTVRWWYEHQTMVRYELRHPAEYAGGQAEPGRRSGRGTAAPAVRVGR